MSVVYVFTRSAWQPAVDIYRTAGGLLLVSEAQGCRPEQLSVTVERHRVILAGVREPPVSAARWLREEIAWGPFERLIELPVPVDPVGARAEYRDGLIMVECPFGAAVSTSVRIAVSTRE